MTQRVLVTAGASGIGREIARAFEAQGAHVFVCDIDENGLATASREGLLTARCDMAQRAEIERMVPTAVDALGGLDVLVNNAGIAGLTLPVEQMPPDSWDKVIAVNLSGAFFMAQAAVEHMVERGTGRIINVSSVIGETGNIGQVNYAASKSGLFGLTKSLAREAIFQVGRAQRPAGDGVGLTVNAVTPGFIATGMLATIPDKVLDRIRDQIPVGRLGEPEEIARVVCFLAADASAYITGQIWAVNGGLDM